MTENEIRRLAHAMNDLRPDWPISSLTTFIHRTELANWTYRDAAVALAWVAADMNVDGTPASETPKRVLEAGPWRKAIVIENPALQVRRPPKRHEECPNHPGQWPQSCAGCATEGRESEYGSGSPEVQPNPAKADASSWAQRIRAGMQVSNETEETA